MQVVTVARVTRPQRDTEYVSRDYSIGQRP